MLGPLLFCFGIADILADIRRQFPNVEVYAFMDDISLVSADPVQLAAAYAFGKPFSKAKSQVRTVGSGLARVHRRPEASGKYEFTYCCGTC